MGYWFLHCDNAPAHSALSVCEFLSKYTLTLVTTSILTRFSIMRLPPLLHKLNMVFKGRGTIIQEKL